MRYESGVHDQWTEDLRLGVNGVDGEHIAIFHVCDRLNQAIARTTTAAECDFELRFLANYVGRHFEGEEQLMRSVDYPALKRHQAAHEKYRQELKALIARAATDHVVLEAIAQSVTSWLTTHIRGEDKALATYLATKRGAAK